MENEDTIHEPAASSAGRAVPSSSSTTRSSTRSGPRAGRFPPAGRRRASPGRRRRASITSRRCGPTCGRRACATSSRRAFSRPTNCRRRLDDEPDDSLVQRLATGSHPVVVAGVGDRGDGRVRRALPPADGSRACERALHRRLAAARS